MTMVRMIIGYDFLIHSTEKLFAGWGAHNSTVQAFVDLGVNYSGAFVFVAGLCEFGAGIGIGSGFLRRIGAAGATLYLIISMFMGHHELYGFIWANPKGGWEFAVFWALLCFIYVSKEDSLFSFDYMIKKKFHPTGLLKEIL